MPSLRLDGIRPDFAFVTRLAVDSRKADDRAAFTAAMSLAGPHVDTLLALWATMVVRLSEEVGLTPAVDDDAQGGHATRLLLNLVAGDPDLPHGFVCAEAAYYVRAVNDFDAAGMSLYLADLLGALESR